MSCLTGYIGLKSLSLEAPEGGYLNILPGISTELVSNLSNKDHATFADLWNDIQERAYGRLKNDIGNTLLSDSKADFRNVIYKTKRLFQAERNPVDVPMSSDYRGVYFSMPQSRYSQLRINEVYVFSRQAADTVFKVFDVNDGKELFTKDISLSIGLNTIAIDQVFDLKYRILEIFAGVDSSLIDTIETRSEYYFLESCTTFSDYYPQSRVYPATIGVLEEKIYDNFSLSSVGHGVVMMAELRCSIDQFICENKHNFSQSWLYLLGAELLNQKLAGEIGSDRLNYFTVSNREVTSETWDLFEKRYIGNLKRDLKGILIDNESICFSCENNLDVFTGGSLP